jgi:hypothetical protein
MSATIGELATALGKAQAELKPAPMDSVNKFLGNRYADLGAIIETAKPVMLKNGLAISQLVGSDGDRVSVTTVLMHTSGEWLKDTVSITVDYEKVKSAAQTAGSLITYLRRYSLSAIMGIYADEDADGGTETQPETKPAARPAPSAPPPKNTTPTPADQPPEQSQTAGADWTKDIKAVKRITNFAFGGNALNDSDLHIALGGKLHDFTGSERDAIEAIKAYVARVAGGAK